MSRMRLKTKLVLAISGMVFALVAVFSYLYVSHLVRQRTTEAYDSADFVAKEIRESAREATQVDLSSTFANESDPKQVEAVLDEALKTDPGLNTLLQAVVGYSPTISDAAIADVKGRAIVNTDPAAIWYAAGAAGRFPESAQRQLSAASSKSCMALRGFTMCIFRFSARGSPSEISASAFQRCFSRAKCSPN